MGESRSWQVSIYHLSFFPFPLPDFLFSPPLFNPHSFLTASGVVHHTGTLLGSAGFAWLGRLVCSWMCGLGLQPLPGNWVCSGHPIFQHQPNTLLPAGIGSCVQLVYTAWKRSERPFSAASPPTIAVLGDLDLLRSPLLCNRNEGRSRNGLRSSLMCLFRSAGL